MWLKSIFKVRSPEPRDEIIIVQGPTKVVPISPFFKCAPIDKKDPDHREYNLTTIMVFIIY